VSTIGDSLTCSPFLQSVPYDPLKDIIPIIQFGVLNLCFVVSSDSPYNSFKDIIDFARKNPGKLTYAIPGVGSLPHLAMEHVIMKEKVDINIVPFPAVVPAVTAVLGGHISVCCGGTSSVITHYKAGKLRVLATTTPKRIEALPDVPTLLELGYPDSAFIEMYVICAPKGTPPHIVKTLEEAFRKAMETSEFITLAKQLYFYEENPLYGQKLKEYVEDKYAKNGEIIRKAKIVK
jgi:tripartite-type tricarboxylate transporter receptor subunit TctC